MSSISLVMLDMRPLQATQLFALGSFCNYSGYFLYLGMITKRFGYIDKFARGLVWALGLASASVFVVWLLGLVGEPGWFYLEGNKAPANLFLANSTGKYTFKLIPKVMSSLGTLVVSATTLYLLWRFAKEKLKGYHRLVLWGVVATLVSKINDFALTTGWGTYLVPLGFFTYFFEIIYFQLAYLKDKNP